MSQVRFILIGSFIWWHSVQKKNDSSHQSGWFITCLPLTDSAHCTDFFYLISIKIILLKIRVIKVYL
jgi:hypothetical protein